MRASEFLRDLADKLDQDTEESTPRPNQAVLTPVKTDNEDQAETTTMVPPLQQKIELLKKVAGVDSIYDDSEESDECDAELAIIRKNAGLSIALDDDFPEV
jgi:hypothetical protein